MTHKSNGKKDMKFSVMYRKMEEMSDTEVSVCVSILLDDANILEIRRDKIQNAIDVTIQLLGISEKEVVLSLLPNDANSEEIMILEDRKELYIEYLIANGYSEYWKDNIFTVLKCTDTEG